jgi:hypothetical protein
MNIKPAIGWLNSDSNGLLVNDVSVVLNAMTDNVAIYDKPVPALPDIQLALDNYSAAVNLVNSGMADTVNRNNLRLVLTNLMRQLACYVTVACKGSLANLILSGFPPQKTTRTPVGIPAQPRGLKLAHGEQLGQLVAKFNPVFGAAIYTYRLTPNTPGAVPVMEQDTAANHTFSNMIAGVKYTVDVSASGAAGTSDWSNPASLTAD